MNMPVRGIQAALLAILSLPAAASPAIAAPPSAPLSIDCARPALPSQRQVGELAGQHNAGQVYATRARLMAEVRRACHRAGAREVLVMRAAPGADARARQLAIGRAPK